MERRDFLLLETLAFLSKEFSSLKQRFVKIVKSEMNNEHLSATCLILISQLRFINITEFEIKVKNIFKKLEIISNIR